MYRTWGATLLFVALAGCFGASEQAAPVFSYTAPNDSLTEPFVFQANVQGDRFVWDFGDGRSPVEGAEVEHLFGARAGTTVVRLVAYDGAIETHYDGVRIDVGSGQNTPPELALQVEQDWVAVDAPFVLSGAASTDPDGDALLFRWSCMRESDVVPKTDIHGEARTPSRPDAIPVTVARAALPADVEPQAICNAPSTFFQEQDRVRLVVAEPGIYRVEMHAKDPTGAARVGAWKIYVTDATPPGPTTVHTFNGTRQIGIPVDDPTGLSDDRDTHTFRVPYDALAMRIDLEPDGGTAGANVTYALRLGDTLWVSETSKDTLLDASRARKGDYTLDVFLRDGIDVAYSVRVTVENDLDPTGFWTAPH